MKEFIWYKTPACIKEDNMPVDFWKDISKQLSEESINMEIPIICQWENDLKKLWLDEDAAKYWSQRSCWIMCVCMALEYFLEKNVYNLQDIEKDKDKYYKFFDFYSWKEKYYKYFEESYWWLHYWLLNIVRRYWLYGSYRKLSSHKNSFLHHIDKLLTQNAVVACSVNFFGDIKNEENNTSWHLVIVNWYDISQNCLFINDPYNSEPIKVDIDDFLEKFNENIFMISEVPHEDFLVRTPFFVNSYNADSPQANILLVHQNEASAVNYCQKLIEQNEFNINILTQNQERFIRYQVENQYVRLDPNRIFSKEWIQKNIQRLNKHLTKNNLSQAVKIWQRIGNYIISKIQADLPIIALHNNISMDIQKLDKKHQNVSITKDMPSNCFVMTTYKEDFDRLKQKWINVVHLDKNWDDGSLSDYCMNNWIRYFNIETGFEESSIQDDLFSKVKDLV